jgi:hypothetical protein
MFLVLQLNRIKEDKIVKSLVFLFLFKNPPIKKFLEFLTKKIEVSTKGRKFQPKDDPTIPY